MLEKQEKGCDSQFLKGCNTTWNLDHELICWINYWFKRYKEEAEIDLQFHRYIYEGVQMTQGEVIDRIIALTEHINSDFYSIEEKTGIESEVEEVFDLIKIVFWNMWW